MRFKERCNSIYLYWVQFPDRCYPFREEVEGLLVRGKRAHDAALARIQQERGYGHYGARLIAFRSVFHILGALLFIGFATLISREFFGSDVALCLLFVFAAVALLYQEFFIQPRILGQRRVHSVVDWLTWVTPMAVYLIIHFT